MQKSQKIEEKKTHLKNTIDDKIQTMKSLRVYPKEKDVVLGYI